MVGLSLESRTARAQVDGTRTVKRKARRTRGSDAERIAALRRISNVKVVSRSA